MKKFMKMSFMFFLCLILACGNFSVVQAGTKKLKLTNTKKVLTVKGTWKVKCNYKASKCKYVSSNKKVATVSKAGLVKAKKAGKTTITVKVKKTKLKAKVKLTVKKATKTTSSSDSSNSSNSSSSSSKTTTIEDPNDPVITDKNDAFYGMTESEKGDSLGDLFHKVK